MSIKLRVVKGELHLSLDQKKTKPHSYRRIYTAFPHAGFLLLRVCSTKAVQVRAALSHSRRGVPESTPVLSFNANLRLPGRSWIRHSPLPNQVVLRDDGLDCLLQLHSHYSMAMSAVIYIYSLPQQAQAVRFMKPLIL